MTDDARIIGILQTALPAVTANGPARDLWPAVVQRRRRARAAWSDVGLAAVLCGALAWEPDWFVWLFYYL